MFQRGTAFFHDQASSVNFNAHLNEVIFHGFQLFVPPQRNENFYPVSGSPEKVSPLFNTLQTKLAQLSGGKAEKFSRALCRRCWLGVGEVKGGCNAKRDKCNAM